MNDTSPVSNGQSRIEQFREYVDEQLPGAGLQLREIPELGATEMSIGFAVSGAILVFHDEMENFVGGPDLFLKLRVDAILDQMKTLLERKVAAWQADPQPDAQQ